jgi:hypothetical protein
MRSFFLSHGPQLVSFNLKICPGDAPLDAWRDVNAIAQTTMLIPPILELCPNITELAISAYGPTSYFWSWRHQNLACATHPSAPGFSTTLANSPCGSSRSLARRTAGMSCRLCSIHHFLSVHLSHCSTNGTHDTTTPRALYHHPL